MTKDHEGGVPIYWLPYKKGHTVYAERDWYENSICEFFLTAQLSGCRFVLTKKYVLHVASDAYGALDGIQGSKTRTDAEKAVTGGTRSRRVSISGASADQPSDGEAGYNHYALVFGMRMGSTWKYKVLHDYRLSSDGGTWISLINP